VLRPDKIKADGQIPIYFSVRVGPSANRLPTGKSILLKDWNSKDNCPKKNTKANELLNSYLNKRMSDWNVFMLENEVMGKPITATIAEGFFKANSKVTFYSFFAEQIGLWKENAPGTLNTYQSTLNVLKQYAPKANFGDINLTWIQKFDIFLTTVRGNTTGGKFTRHKCLKSVINTAIMKGFMPAAPHPYKHFKIKAAKSNRSFLTIKELQQVVKVNLPEEEIMLEKVKDLFLFSAYTGLRYSDVQNLQWMHISSNPDLIKIKMQKTSSEITIPLTASAKAILDKYGKHCIKTPNATILPQISNQVVNRNLKLVIERARIKKAVSFHSARHSFASQLIEAGTNIVYVQKLLGHSSIADTMIYSHINNADIHTSMDNLQKMYQQAI
jgi:integrase/recombinase XerD